MTESRAFDVVIAGAGLVGTSLAVALARGRTRVALVDPVALPADEPRRDGWDSRIYAISPASIAFLDAIGAWAHVGRDRVASCVRMQIRGDTRTSELDFSAYEAGVSELAVMAESREIARALAVVARRTPNLTVFAPMRCATFDRWNGGARIVLEEGTALETALVVGADGARSWIREQAGIAAQVLPYDQVAVVANFAVGRPHLGTAFQWFLGDAVLAWLPLPGDRMSMVWSCPAPLADELLALAPQVLADRVAEAGEHALGALELLTAPRAFPLSRVIADRLIDDRVALVGDAAHVVHPLAGQGVNLGFADARDLAAILHGREVFRDCGDRRLLRTYERGRGEAILAMRSVTHGLKSLFGLPGTVPKLLRNAGLDLAGRLPAIKNALARRALG